MSHVMSLLQTEWPTVKKEVNGAVSFDLANGIGGGDGGFLAYKNYLDCLVKLLSLLRQDASSCLSNGGGVVVVVVTPEIVAQRRNFVKLSQQCLDRVNDLADSSPPPPPPPPPPSGGGGSGGTSKIVDGHATKPTNVAGEDDITLLLPDVPCDTPPIPGTASAGGSNLPASTPPGGTTSSPASTPWTHPSGGPTSSTSKPSLPSVGGGGAGGGAKMDQRRVDATTAAFRRRTGGSVRYLPNVNLAQNQKATLNMAAYRKMEEGRKIAEKVKDRMEKQLEERRKTLEKDAMERFKAGDSSVDREKAKFFAAATLVEQDDAVLALLRKKLVATRQAGKADEEAKYIDALLNKIVALPNHPLAELIIRHRRTLTSRLKPLITPYIRALDAVVVPYVGESKSTVELQQQDTSSPPTSRGGSIIIVNQDDDDDASAAITDDDFIKDNSEYVADLEKRQFERQKLHILEEEAFERHLDAVATDVRMAVEVIMSELTLLYGEGTFEGGEDAVAAGAAWDRAYGNIEKIFFAPPLWPLLVNMFRLGNKQDEIQLAKIMTNNADLTPADVGVPPHLCLSSSLPSCSSHGRHGFEPVVKELHRLATFSSPLAKLECLVNLCKVVCACVDDIKSANAASSSSTGGSGGSPSAGSLGADDLLPILSFAILRSAMPQLVSESRAMSEFIHESYQMGEEGYCLISLQTAIGYLMRLDEED